MIEKWKKELIREQPSKLLKYNLKVGKMSKEKEIFIKKELKERTNKK